MSYFKRISLIFPILFVIELVFGFSGTMLMIGGLAIRHILFILTFISLYVYFLGFIYINKIKIFSLKKDSYFGSYTKIDLMAVLFELSMIFSMTVIPWIMGTNLHYAYSEVFDSIAIFSLYFPLAFLFKTKELSMDSFLKLLKYLILLFAIMHLIFYFGQECMPGFIQGFFDGFSALFNGHSITPRVVLGHGGYTRVMFTTSIYLMIGIYIFLREINKFTWYNIVILVVDILAVITTVTKSLWFGILIAFVIYLILMLWRYKKDYHMIKKLIFSGVIAIVVVIASNAVLFNHIVSIRVENAFVSDATYLNESYKESEEENGKDDKEQEIEKLDREGAVESNQIKLEQIQHLTEKWLKAPIFGWGYGSYVEDYLRSEVSPFSYEMQAFALLMKIGILGMAIWIGFFVSQIICFLKKIKKIGFYKMGAWLFLLIAMAVCVQTNPLLISFTGMSVVLLISLISVNNYADVEKD